MSEKTLAQALLDLHRPWYEISGKRHEHRVYVHTDDLDAAPNHVCVIGEAAGLHEPCEPGEMHLVEACIECRQVTEDGDPAFPIWPCPTAQLAQQALQ